MHALAEFIHEQMRVRGWKEQKDLAEASGVPKSTLSQILDEDRPLQRPLGTTTVKRLATAFASTSTEPSAEQREKAIHNWEQMIRLKAAEAIGVPTNESVIITVEPSDEYVLEVVREALALRRRLREQPVSMDDQSTVDAASNLADNGGAVSDDFSGEKRTVGDPRIPGRPQSRGSDEDAPEQRRTSERSAPPRI